MKEKIIDLMKNKVNSTDTKTYKKLNITPKDNLYSAYKKLAMYLYENSALPEQEKTDLATIVVKKRLGIGATNFKHITRDDMSDSDIYTVKQSLKKTNAAKTDEWDQYVYYTDQVETGNKRQVGTICLVFSPSGSFKNTVLKKWYYKFNRKTGKKDIIVLVNLPQTYGYSLIEDELNNYLTTNQRNNRIVKDLIDYLCDQNLSKAKFDEFYPEIPDLIERKKYAKDIDLSECTISDVNVHYSDGDLVDFYILPEGSYVCGMRYDRNFKRAFRFLSANNTGYEVTKMVEVTLPKEDKRVFILKKELKSLLTKYEGMSYLKNYLTHVKNIVIQHEYDYEQQKNATKARFFEQKKNINKSTMAAMTRMSNFLDNRFRAVEIDNDVDLDKLNNIKDELKKTALLLPKVSSGVKPVLRFRKLRNLHALGAYFNMNQTLAVDFRSDSNGKAEKGVGRVNIGLQSFVHEYGHFLDYNFATDGQLSLKQDFELILQSTQSYIFKCKALTSSKQNYLATPTEVFARAFELYVSNCNLDNEFIKDPERYHNSMSFEFTCFANVESDIEDYFDKLFPDLKSKIKTSKQFLVKNSESTIIKSNASLVETETNSTRDTNVKNYHQDSRDSNKFVLSNMNVTQLSLF